DYLDEELAALDGLTDAFAAKNDPIGWGRVFTFGMESVAGAAQSVQSASRCVFMRYITGGTITKVALHVGVASGNISVAVFADDGTGGAPGTRKGTSGAVSCPSAGYAEVSLGGSVDVNAGDYLALSCDNT